MPKRKIQQVFQEKNELIPEAKDAISKIADFTNQLFRI